MNTIKIFRRLSIFFYLVSDIATAMLLLIYLLSCMQESYLLPLLYFTSLMLGFRGVLYLLLKKAYKLLFAIIIVSIALGLIFSLDVALAIYFLLGIVSIFSLRTYRYIKLYKL